MFNRSRFLLLVLAAVASLNLSLFSQTKTDDKASAVLSKAIETMGGQRYLQVRTQVGRGQFSVIRDNTVVSFQSFTDVIVFPDKERTEFRGGGSKNVQTNTGKTGWVYDGEQDVIKVQTEKQVENFARSLRVSLDNLLRGYWKGEADLTYAGRRPATLGKRNDVIKLTYKDGFAIEFEFADDGTPAKSIYKQNAADGTEITQEDRYAQFVDVGGVKTPFIIDRFTNGAQNSRINYESVEFNKTIPESVFEKPSNPKELKKDLKIS
jgi:hypothetical protein